MFELYIGNKNYSSWSMRPWLILKHYQIDFKEHWIEYDDFKKEHPFKQKVLSLSPAGKVPILKHDDLIIWDSLAICEYLAEQHPHLNIWPKEIKQRAYARAICAEMHSGFSALRSLCCMNIAADLKEIGRQHWNDHQELREDVRRIEAIWKNRPTNAKYLLGDNFTIVDAFYAPVVMRLIGYQLPVSASSKDYMQQILNMTVVQKWITDAKNEKQFIQAQEPDRQANSNE